MFGDAYKIARKQMVIPFPRVQMRIQEEISHFRNLIMTGDNISSYQADEVQDDVDETQISQEEVLEAARKIKLRKAPGPDRLPGGSKLFGVK